ncbi:MAG: hypothetical protein AAF389_04175 [Gemmatimonadota bacterium]
MRRLLLSAAVMVAFAGCGPEGPGPLTGRVTGEDLGAVLLRVEGPGVVSFNGLGDTQVYAAPVADRPDTHRVILVDPQGTDLAFEMQVEDRGMEGPVITVLQAALTSNRAVSAAVATVTIER